MNRTTKKFSLTTRSQQHSRPTKQTGTTVAFYSTSSSQASFERMVQVQYEQVGSTGRLHRISRTRFSVRNDDALVAWLAQLGPRTLSAAKGGASDVTGSRSEAPPWRDNFAREREFGPGSLGYKRKLLTLKLVTHLTYWLSDNKLNEVRTIGGQREGQQRKKTHRWSCVKWSLSGIFCVD